MTSTILEQLKARDTLTLAENPTDLTPWLPDGLRKRLEKFMQKSNLMAHREGYQSKNRRESLEDFLAKAGGIAAFGVGAASGVGLPISAVLALLANNVFRQNAKSRAKFQEGRAKELEQNLVLKKKLDAKGVLTPDENDAHHKAVLEINRLASMSKIDVMLQGASFPFKTVSRMLQETYKNMSPNAKFVKTEGITARNIGRAFRVFPVLGLGTMYKSVSGLAFSAGNVIHSANMAIRAVPKIYDWEKVKFSKIQDKGVAWIADKFDGFMKGKWLTKAKDAMTKLSQWPSARESKGANMAMAPS